MYITATCVYNLHANNNKKNIFKNRKVNNKIYLIIFKK